MMQCHSSVFINRPLKLEQNILYLRVRRKRTFVSFIKFRSNKRRCVSLQRQVNSVKWTYVYLLFGVWIKKVSLNVSFMVNRERTFAKNLLHSIRLFIHGQVVFSPIQSTISKLTENRKKYTTR